MAKHEGGLGDAPIQPELHMKMNALAESLNTLLNPGQEKGQRTWGFILMVFPFNSHDGRCNYISSGKREDVVVLLKEQLARFHGQPEVSGRA